MSNWMTCGLTSKKVGFGIDGGVCEGGSCDHLKEGDRAYGHSSENDSMGSEMYLYCKPCYEHFLETQRNELVTCSDCQGEFARRDTVHYSPYDPGAPVFEQIRMRICKGCHQASRHQDRLKRDRLEMEQDDQDPEGTWDPNYEDPED